MFTKESVEEILNLQSKGGMATLSGKASSQCNPQA